MADSIQEQAPHYATGGAAPSAPPPITDHDRALSFVADQLASSMANAALATSMYGKTKDISEIIKIVTNAPDLSVGLHVPPDKVTTVAGQPDFTRLEMQVGAHKEIIAIPNKQLEELGALPNVMAAQELQPQPAKQQSAPEHPLANHPDVVGAIHQVRAALNNPETSTGNSAAQASARGNGYGGR